MDQSQVEKIQLTRYGFRLNLIRFSTFLSIFGIVASVLGFFLSIVSIVVLVAYTSSNADEKGGEIGKGAVILVLFGLYLVLWILLKIKTGERDIPGIENITKIYCYVTGTLEIIGMIGFIIWSIRIIILTILYVYYLTTSVIIAEVIALIIWLVYLVFVCLKIHGIRTQKNEMLSKYIVFRHVIFIIITILLLISIRTSWILLISWIFFYILDIGLIVILHSIRVDGGKKSTETPMYV